MYLSDAAFARSGFRARAVDRPPRGDMGGPGRTGLLGTGPRAMPLRAAPGEKLGAAACAAGTKRNRCCRCPLHALPGACQLGNARTRPSLAAKALATPVLLGGIRGRDDEGRG